MKEREDAEYLRVSIVNRLAGCWLLVTIGVKLAGCWNFYERLILSYLNQLQSTSILVYINYYLFVCHFV